MNDLKDLCFLVTRPEPQGRELCGEITSRGGSAVSFPVIAFSPPPDHSAYLQCIAALGHQDWLIFISPQSVYSTTEAMTKAWPRLPERVNIAAIGAGTAKALNQAGLHVDIHPHSDWSSDGILALPAFQSVKGQKIAVLRGAGGRELVDQALSDRGAKVMTVIAYERVLPDVDTRPVLDLLRKNKIDVIICTSFEGVKNLKTLLGEDGWLFIRKIPLVVMSERIKSLAHDLGFQTIWVTRNASQTAILDKCKEGLNNDRPTRNPG